MKTSSVDELKKYLKNLKLEGRKITFIKTNSLCYGHARYNLEEVAYGRMKGMEEEQRQYLSNYENISDTFRFTRWCEIDEPFMLRFEDGDILELDTPMEPFFKIDMNSGEWHKDSDRNNLILNDFFDVCIDKRIVEVEVKTYRTDSPPVWYWFDDNYEQGKEQDWIGAVILWLDNGIGLEITGEIDYTCIACIHHNGEPITIPFSKLKKALCNQEDLYEDTYIGFETKDRALLCGTNGYRKAEAPWVTISDTCRGSRMCINEEDFAFFADGFYRVTGDYFDIYGDYELTYSMWMEILKKSLEICEKKNSNTEEDEKLIFRINELIRWSKAVHTLTGKIMLNGF